MWRGPEAPAEPTEAGEVDAVEAAAGGAGAEAGLAPEAAPPPPLWAPAEGLSALVCGITAGGLPSSYRPLFIMVHQAGPEELPDAVAGDPAMLHSGPPIAPTLLTLSGYSAGAAVEHATGSPIVMMVMVVERPP